MKAVVIEAPGKAVLVEKALPQPPIGWARVRVKAACVCATDLEVLDGNIPADYPLTPGHEWSGVVDAVGDPNDAAWISKRVVGSNDICCLTCQECRSGNWRNCASFREIGFRADGAYAEYLLVPVYALYELPGCLSYIQGALIEPLGVGLGVLEKAGLRAGETLTIIGAGPIGLSIAAVAKAMGAGRMVVAASSKSRLGFAKQAGAFQTVATREESLEEAVQNCHPGGSHIVCEATGSMDCFTTALRLVKKSGCVVLAGYGGGKSVEVKPDQIHIPNLRIIGAGNNWNMVGRCLKLLEYGLADTSFIATHFFQLQEFEKALELTRTRPQGFLKSVFLFGEKP